MRSRVAGVCALLLTAATAAAGQTPAKAKGIEQARQQVAGALVAQDLTAALNAYEQLVALQGAPDAPLMHELAHTALTSLEKSREPYVRDGACAALADESGQRCGEPAPDVDGLRGALDDRRQSLSAVARLRDGGDKAVAPLILLLNESPFPEVQYSAAAQLGQTHSEAAKNALRAFITGRPDSPVRHAAVLSLGLLGDQNGLDEVRRLLPNLTGDDRLTAARALAAAGDPAAEQLFQDSIGGESDSVRIDAAVQMARLSPPQARDTLRSGLGASNVFIRAAAAQGYATLNWEPTRELRALLLDPNDIVRLRAAQAMHAWARSH
jgi:HEAT repeats